MLLMHMGNLVRQFTDYVAGVAGELVTCGDCVSASLPQYLTQQYSLLDITIGRRHFLGVLLKDSAETRPAVMEKHLQQILTAVPGREGGCLVAEDLPGYVRNRLVERKVPFIVPGRQLYWPELGLAIQARKKKQAPTAVTTVSPATQAVLIYALTGGMTEPATPKLLSKALGFTAMSMTRALDEIEANGLGRVTREGRERVLAFPEGNKALWLAALPYLRNPVRETVRIMEQQLPEKMRIQAGETALAAQSMLVPPREAVYALGRQTWKDLAAKVEKIPVEDDGTCRIQIWRYDPALFAKDGRVDGFSLYLSLRDLAEERVEAALEEMMERLPWS